MFLLIFIIPNEFLFLNEIIKALHYYISYYFFMYLKTFVISDLLILQDWWLWKETFFSLTFFVIAIWLLKGKSKYVKKQLMYGSFVSHNLNFFTSKKRTLPLYICRKKQGGLLPRQGSNMEHPHKGWNGRGVNWCIHVVIGIWPGGWEACLCSKDSPLGKKRKRKLDRIYTKKPKGLFIYNWLFIPWI